MLLNISHINIEFLVVFLIYGITCDFVYLIFAIFAKRIHGTFRLLPVSGRCITWKSNYMKNTKCAAFYMSLLVTINFCDVGIVCLSVLLECVYELLSASVRLCVCLHSVYLFLHLRCLLHL